jgi:predicted SprT family Zn-dependent metalloprotease
VAALQDARERCSCDRTTKSPHATGQNSSASLRSCAPLRLSGGESTGFNVVACVRALAQKAILKTGKLIIEFFTASEKQTPAYVTYNPTTLHIDLETWQDADLGEPLARFIIAHELGHVVLHDSHAQPFSGIKQKWIQFDEESAEWQANVFADCFLVSDSDIDNSTSVFELAMLCSVDRSTAVRRLHARYRCCGYACETCGSNSVLQVGITRQCIECGWAVSV